MIKPFFVPLKLVSPEQPETAGVPCSLYIYIYYVNHAKVLAQLVPFGPQSATTLKSRQQYS